MVIKEIETKDYVSKSNLPFCDYVINPYVGCLFGCKYCYASFMKRFTGHLEKWGTFLNVKRCSKPINSQKLTGKSIFLSSVTDPYNPIEKKYGITRKILEESSKIDCHLYISTRSPLVTRDIDLFKKCSDIIVAVSLNTLDDCFRQDMDRGGSVQQRLDTLKNLHEKGIRTALFIAPWFPEITDFQALMNTTEDFTDEYWFENLNLRGDYKRTIFDYIREHYPQHMALYDDIYWHKNNTYWEQKEKEFEAYCKTKNVRYRNAFYHTEQVSRKKKTGVLINCG